MFKVLGVVLVVLAIFAAVFPMFTDCQSQGKAITLANGKTIPMKCHWSGIAEMAAAAPLAVVGVMMTFNRRKTYPYAVGRARSGAGRGDYRPADLSDRRVPDPDYDLRHPGEACYWHHQGCC